MADRAHMSPSTFRQHFRALTGVSPLQYQKQLRLQEARQLMLNENLDAGTAAVMWGMKAPRSSAASTVACLARRLSAISRACGSHQLPSPRALAERQQRPRLAERVSTLDLFGRRSCPGELATVASRRVRRRRGRCRRSASGGRAEARGVGRSSSGNSRPQGFYPEVLGEYAERQASSTRLTLLGVIAVAAIFLILMADFGSARVATLIFLTLPFALVGAIVAHGLRVGHGFWAESAACHPDNLITYAVVPGAVRLGHRRVVARVLPRVADGAGVLGGTDRQAQSAVHHCVGDSLVA